MAGTRGATNPTWFGDHSGLALFVVGCALLLAGVFVPDRGATATAATLFIGGGMVFVGALLPRLSGPIKVTPASIEMAVAERLDATRREARARTPGYEDQAVLRAVEVLLEQLRTAGVRPAVGQEQADRPVTAGGPAAPEVAAPPWRAVPEPPPESESQPVGAPPSGPLPGSSGSRTSQRSTPRRTRAPRGWVVAPAAAVVLALVVLTPLGWLAFEQRLDEVPGDADRPAMPPTDAPSDEEEPVDDPDPDAPDDEAPRDSPAEPPGDPAGARALKVLGYLVAAAVLTALAWLAWRARHVRLAHALRREQAPPFAEAPQEFARHIVDGLMAAGPDSGGQSVDERPR